MFALENPDSATRNRALAVVFRSYSHFGIEAYLDGLLPALADAGMDVSLLVLGAIEPTARQRLQDAGVHVIVEDIEAGLSGMHPITRRFVRRRAMRLALRKTLRAHQYEIIHMHTTGASYHHIALEEACRNNVAIRICHGHGAIPAPNLHVRLMRPFYRWSISRKATYIAACSNTAGIDLFGESPWRTRGIFIPNGIDADCFASNPVARNNLRQNDPDALVVGFVGRLSPQKNPSKLLRAFKAVKQLEPHSVLWVVGDGELRGPLQDEAHALGVGTQVVFWGDRSDVAELLQGMDCFVMPSRFEGLPIALLEAQSAGLPCVISDSIDEQSVIPGCPVVRLDIAAPDANWANEIIALKGKRIEDGAEKVRAAGFSREQSANQVLQLYRGQGPALKDASSQHG